MEYRKTLTRVTQTMTRKRILKLAIITAAITFIMMISSPPNETGIMKHVLTSINLDRFLVESSLTQVELQRISVFENAAPSVVNIDTFKEKKSKFSTDMTEIPLGSGTGFVWDDKGHIVTNYHVISKSKIAKVTFLVPNNSGTSAAILHGVSSESSTPALSNYIQITRSAEITGIDPANDIAVLKIKWDKDDSSLLDDLLKPITLGTSSNLQVGQNALAIGNPYGLDHTLTRGIISGLERQFASITGRPINNVIQTDASINPGNSGGPLLDSSGNLIGMNMAILSPSGASAGLGFAIPVDTLDLIVSTLIQYGKVVRPVLGITFVDPAEATVMGVIKGVMVWKVPKGGPAEKAGLRGTTQLMNGVMFELGDIIIKFDDNDIEDEMDLFKSLEMKEVGDDVMLTVVRYDMQEVALSLKLGSSDDK